MNQPATILVVDDLAANRETLLELLAAEKYRILEAADGPTALRLAAEDPPDLVLLDVMMPGMDGFTVCRRLRADARLAEVPVIMVTALDDPESRLTGLQAGADDFITKPFNRSELRARVRTVTRLNRYRRLVDAQSALRESETRFREMAENIQDVFWLADPEKARKIYISPAYEKIWGRTCQSAYDSPHDWIEAIHPEDRDRVRHAAETKQTTGIYDEEFRVRRPDGTERWVHDRAFPVLDPDGGIKCWVGVARDITGNKQAEEALRESEKRFLGAFEQAPIGVALVSPEGRWLKVNQALCDLVGYSETELQTRTIADLTHPADVELSQEFVRRAIAGQSGTLQFEKRYLHKRGHVITALLNISLVRDNREQPRYFISQIQDLTQRKLSEAALEHAHQELVETSRRAGMAEVATGILHNVGNVLNSVNVASNCLADNLRKSQSTNLSKVGALLRAHEADLGAFFTNDPRGKQLPGYLALLAEHLAGEQAAALIELAQLQKNIEHIKEIVRMQQGFAKVAGLRETLQVSDLVEDALQMNASSFARHDIEIIREFERVPAVSVEKHKVLQILINLVRNAKHACDASGRPDKRLTLRVTAGKGHVRITVIDNGVGIPPETLTRIFAHGFTTKKDGHGFGLHSGALAAREMGGSLSVHSEGPGQGATFSLELPSTSEIIGSIL